MPAALLSTVFLSVIVRIGLTSPVAPAAYTRTPETRLKLVTASVWVPLTGLVGPSWSQSRTTGVADVRSATALSRHAAFAVHCASPRRLLMPRGTHPPCHRSSRTLRA